jgi:hypothetical protein
MLDRQKIVLRTRAESSSRSARSGWPVNASMRRPYSGRSRLGSLTKQVFRPGGISYLRIPAPDPRAAADFYGTVFGSDLVVAAIRDPLGNVVGIWQASDAS